MSQKKIADHKKTDRKFGSKALKTTTRLTLPKSNPLSPAEQTKTETDTLPAFLRKKKQNKEAQELPQTPALKSTKKLPGIEDLQAVLDKPKKEATQVKAPPLPKGGSISIQEPSASFEIQIIGNSKDGNPKQTSVRYSPNEDFQMAEAAKTKTSTKVPPPPTPNELDLDFGDDGDLAPVEEFTKTGNTSKFPKGNPEDPAIPTEIAPKNPDEHSHSIVGAEINRETLAEETLARLAAPQTISIQPSKKRTKKAEPINRWHLNTLKKSRDPIGVVLSQLLHEGVQSALFLSITRPPEGARLPHFVAKAAHAEPERIKVWTGLRWDPIIAPDLWHEFLDRGYSILAPEENPLVRNAFGAQEHETLTIARVGPASSCRGMLLLVSHSNIENALESRMELLQSGPAKKQAA